MTISKTFRDRLFEWPLMGKKYNKPTLLYDATPNLTFSIRKLGF